MKNLRSLKVEKNLKLFGRGAILVLFHLLLLTSSVDAQDSAPTGIQYYPFMNKLPRDYKYYKTGYDESKKTIEDPTIIWTEKEFPYWRYMVANIGLLAPDSLIKEIWKEVYENSPHSACGMYSFLFERPFVPEYLSNAPVVYYYLHNEKMFFDSTCNGLYSKYDSSVILELRVIVTEDHGRDKRELNIDQFRRDSINQIKVAKMIKRLGKYPGRSVVSNNLEDVAWLVIQHAPLVYQEKYLPFIKKAVLEKDLAPKYLAYSLDRINMAKDLPQVYGTQYVYEEDKNIMYPIEDMTHVDQLRKSVGLGPLKKYMEEAKIYFK